MSSDWRRHVDSPDLEQESPGSVEEGTGFMTPTVTAGY